MYALRTYFLFLYYPSEDWFLSTSSIQSIERFSKTLTVLRHIILIFKIFKSFNLKLLYSGTLF